MATNSVAINEYFMWTCRIIPNSLESGKFYFAQPYAEVTGVACIRFTLQCTWWRTLSLPEWTNRLQSSRDGAPLGIHSMFNMIRWSIHILQIRPIGSILNPLTGKFSEDTRKKGKGAKTGSSHDWQSFYLSKYDWLKGSHMTKVVWLPNETDYPYYEFVAPNTPY